MLLVALSVPRSVTQNARLSNEGQIQTFKLTDGHYQIFYLPATQSIIRHNTQPILLLKPAPDSLLWRTIVITFIPIQLNHRESVSLLIQLKVHRSTVFFPFPLRNVEFILLSWLKFNLKFLIPLHKERRVSLLSHIPSICLCLMPISLAASTHLITQSEGKWRVLSGQLISQRECILNWSFSLWTVHIHIYWLVNVGLDRWKSCTPISLSCQTKQTHGQTMLKSAFRQALNEPLRKNEKII